MAAALRCAMEAPKASSMGWRNPQPWSDLWRDRQPSVGCELLRCQLLDHQRSGDSASSRSIRRLDMQDRAFSRLGRRCEIANHALVNGGSCTRILRELFEKDFAVRSRRACELVLNQSKQLPKQLVRRHEINCCNI